MNRALFLDRDGVINEDHDYVYKIEELDFIPGAVEALKKLQEDYILIIITNQSGIGRGYYSEEDYLKFRKELHRQLKDSGVLITDEYYCKHAPEEDCRCRKPGTGMIEQAAKDHDIDIKNSYLIGDKTSDILAGKNAGMKTILVMTGKAGKDGLYEVEADFVCNDLGSVIGIIK